MGVHLYMFKLTRPRVVCRRKLPRPRYGWVYGSERYV
jgi:hypothetical protein